MQLPADLFIERLQGEAAVAALLWQVFWAVAMLGAAHALTQLATRRVVVQGG
jgi:ABC-2 type transport system permease protein